MGFIRDAYFKASTSTVSKTSLRQDLQGCADRLDPKDASTFLALCNGWEDDLAQIPSGERVSAVLPTDGRQQDEYDGPFGRGALVLTTERLLYLGNGGGGIFGSTGRIEIPMHQISMSGWGIGRRWAISILEVSVGPNNSPIYGFRLSSAQKSSQESFLEAFETVVRESERRRSRVMDGGGEMSTPSTATELAKLAELLNAGVITDEEFAAQKARLLQ